jgi:hypothetical protein
MSRFALLLVSALSVLTAEAQQLGFSLAEGRRRVEIPVEIYNNLVVVPVLLNGKLPMKFIVDTGVRTAILTEKSFTDILNLTYTRRYSISGAGATQTIEAYVTTGVDLILPGVVGHGHSLLVLERDYLELRNFLGADIHGILGYELFSRFIVQIDYVNKRLVLMAPEKFTPGRRFEEIPIKIEDTKPYLLAGVELQDGTQITAKLLMDSGASHGLLLEPTSDKKITVPEASLATIIGRGLGGEITGRVGRIKSMQLGRFRFDDVIANFPDENSYADTLKLGRVFRNGTIGGEILSRFTVIFDFPREKVYLRKNGAFGKNFYYNMSGTTIRAMGSRLNSFEIADVRQGSSGEEAGLQKGDILLFINGITVREMDLNIINGFFNARPGRTLNLEIRRGEQHLKKRLTLKNQI